MSVRRIAFLEEARVELHEAAAHYEGQAAGLGEEFVEEVERAVAFAVHHPELGSPGEEDTRRVLVRRFPFHVVYRVRSSELLVVAVAHQRRRPDYWRHRP